MRIARTYDLASSVTANKENIEFFISQIRSIKCDLNLMLLHLGYAMGLAFSLELHPSTTSTT